jgi:hypothetical protein
MRSVAFGGLAAGQDDHPPVDPPDVTALAAVVLEVPIEPEAWVWSSRHPGIVLNEIVLFNIVIDATNEGGDHGRI